MQQCQNSDVVSSEAENEISSHQIRYNEALKNKYSDDRIVLKHKIGMNVDSAKETVAEKLFGKDNKPAVKDRITNYMNN